MDQLLQSARLADVWEELVYLASNPNTNITAALLLLSIIVITVLMVAAVVIAVVTRPSRRGQSHRQLEELEYYLGVIRAAETRDAEDGTTEHHDAASDFEELTPTWYRRAVWLAGAFAVALILGVAVGVTSASPAVCLSCHEANPHSAVVDAGGADPHESTDCVWCHEGTGVLGLVTVEVPGRLVHFAEGLVTDGKPRPYGHVLSPACLRCHDAVLGEITEDDVRGVRMSHAEPAEAGAECGDCHTLDPGVVSTATSGMAPCLRCHDGVTESSECDVCHTKDVSLATRPSTNFAEMVGRPLVPTPDCGGCHNQVTQCDPCHGGQRMPHTELFLWWGHARAGVMDLWYNDGDTCGRCHTAERRPCTRCHAFFPGHPVGFFSRHHGDAGDTGGCNGCHNRRAYVNERVFCDLCHGEPLITR